MPSRARAGTTKESKDKYIAATLKAAGVTSMTETRQVEDDEAEETQREAGATEQEADDKNEEVLRVEIDDEVEETPQVEAGEQEVEPPESQSHQDRSNRGWEVNYLLDYESLYSNDEDNHFVEDPLASEDREGLRQSRR